MFALLGFVLMLLSNVAKGIITLKFVHLACN